MTTQTKIILAVSVLAVGSVGTYMALQSAKKSVPPTVTVTTTTNGVTHGGLLQAISNLNLASLVGL